MQYLRHICCVLLMLAILSVVGCYSPYMRWPELYHPGTANQQRAVAEIYDPYPSPDAGPEVVGGRPPGFERPLTETEWGRRYARPDGALQPAPIPTFPGSPVLTTPYPAAPPAQGTPFQIQPRAPY